MITTPMKNVGSPIGDEYIALNALNADLVKCINIYVDFFGYSFGRFYLHSLQSTI